MGIFISVPKTVECILVTVVFAVLLWLSAYRQTGVLQSSGYSNKKYFRWVSKKGNMAFQRFVFIAMLSALASAVISLAFSFAGQWAAVAGLAAYVIFYAVYFAADKKIALRSSVVKTPRFMRLYVTLFLVSAIVSYLVVTLVNFADYLIDSNMFSVLRYVPLGILPLLTIPLILLSNAIIKIYEVPHSGKFIRRAKSKLAKSNIKIIGITGSYGKTSTKYILNAVLSSKYRVLSTPRSHNTPIGIALAINNANLEGYDVFIAEMGARHTGDIAELCTICPPDISLITGVCGQHLETFGTFKNIVAAKAEILSATKNTAIIADDCFDLFADYGANKLRCGSVSDIVCTITGTQFTLTLGGQSRRINTVLLGRHAAYNMGLAAEAAQLMGMDIDQIAHALEGVDYIEHRLQPMVNNGVRIIDDGYNSNVKGAAAALEVLRLADGRRIAVTPGLVELGVLEQQENYALGKKLVGLDRVILVGDTLVTPVKKGYLDGGGDKDKITVCPTLTAAQEQLKGYLAPGDTVLFLNDLPDVY